jgi:hypothetical protein
MEKKISEGTGGSIRMKGSTRTKKTKEKKEEEERIKKMKEDSEKDLKHGNFLESQDSVNTTTEVMTTKEGEV